MKDDKASLQKLKLLQNVTAPIQEPCTQSRCRCAFYTLKTGAGSAGVKRPSYSLGHRSTLAKRRME